MRVAINNGRPTEAMLEIARYTMRSIRQFLRKVDGVEHIGIPCVGRIDYEVSKHQNYRPVDDGEINYFVEMVKNPRMVRSFTSLSQQFPDFYNEALLERICEHLNADPNIPSNVLAFPSPHNDRLGCLNLVIVFADYDYEKTYVDTPQASAGAVVPSRKRKKSPYELLG